MNKHRGPFVKGNKCKVLTGSRESFKSLEVPYRTHHMTVEAPSVLTRRLEQFLNAAGVLPDGHGGLIGGVGQDGECFILTFQLCFGLQGQALQLKQHLQCTQKNLIKTNNNKNPTLN